MRPAINLIAHAIDTVMSRREYQYWALQAIGWGGYLFFILLSAVLYDRVDGVMVMYTASAMLTGLVLSMIIREGLRMTWEKPLGMRVALTLGYIVVTSAVWSYIKFYAAYRIWRIVEMEKAFAEYLHWFSYSFCILLAWTGLYFGIRYYQMMQQEREKSLRISAMAHQAQLKMLRYQLNPHFLFNTLNAISTLIMDQRGQVANRMVTGLSKFLRYSLDNDPMQKITLAQEVDAMKLYLDIEKVRFEDRLEVALHVEEGASRALIPSLLLQPLIENAIKYAVARSETGGTIRLDARVVDGDLLLEVSDDGPGVALVDGMLPPANGVGLTNTRERLQVLYGERQSCDFSLAEPHGLKVSIRIPYEVEERGAWKN